MSIDKSKIGNNKKTIFPIILGVLLATFIIGGLCYYFITDKPSEEPVKEIIEDSQETENNNEENIENKKEEVIIKNKYIPVIDNLLLNILAFLIIAVVSFVITFKIGKKIEREIRPKLQEKGYKYLIYFFSLSFEKEDEKRTTLILVQFFIGFLIIHQVVVYAIWFILILIFAAFSKIWDKEHSWWSNVVKGFFRNRIHRGWLLLIPISSIAIIIIILLIFLKIEFNKNGAEEADGVENNEPEQ